MQNFNLFILVLFVTNISVNAQCVSGDCVNGQGTYQWKSGAFYTGEFVDGVRHGYGFYTYSNGNTYLGEWVNSNREGYGIYTYNDSKLKSYAGEWKSNSRNGIGILYYKDEKIAVRFGVWEENSYLYKYKKLGCVEGNCFEGKGLYVWNDGSRYEGEFKNGKREGEGVYYYPKGAKYVGTQANGKRNGYGTYYYTNGKKYIGKWKDDMREEGTFYTKEGIKSSKASLENDKISAKIQMMKPALVSIENGGTAIVINEKELEIEGIIRDENKIIGVRTSAFLSELMDKGEVTKSFVGKVILSEGENIFWVESENKIGNKTRRTYRIIYKPK